MLTISSLQPNTHRRAVKAAIGKHEDEGVRKTLMIHIDFFSFHLILATVEERKASSWLYQQASNHIDPRSLFKGSKLNEIYQSASFNIHLNILQVCHSCVSGNDISSAKKAARTASAAEVDASSALKRTAPLLVQNRASSKPNCGGEEISLGGEGFLRRRSGTPS